MQKKKEKIFQVRMLFLSVTLRSDSPLCFWGLCKIHLEPVLYTSSLKPLKFTEISLNSQALHSLQKYSLGVSTCNEGIFNSKAEAFQLLITGELDPHETARWCNQARVLAPTEAVDEWREPKWSVTDFDVIEAALEWWLDVVILIKSQLNPLSRESFGEQGSG